MDGGGGGRFMLLTLSIFSFPIASLHHCHSSFASSSLLHFLLNCFLKFHLFIAFSSFQFFLFFSTFSFFFNKNRFNFFIEKKRKKKKKGEVKRKKAKKHLHLLQELKTKNIKSKKKEE